MSDNGTSPRGLVEVAVGPCRCPNTPHVDGDIVYLYPELGMAGGLAAQVALALSTSMQERVTGMTLALIDYGVADWTFTDAKGAKVDINPATIRGALPWKRGGREVAEKAADLYQDIVNVPLAPRPRKRTSKTPTGSS